MAVSLGTHASFTMATFLGMAVFLLLMMPVTHAEKDISLEIRYVEAFRVFFDCRYNYDGDMTDVMFAAFNGSSKCLERSGNYGMMEIYNSDFNFVEEKDPKSLEFVVELDRSCDQIVDVRCQISNIIAGSMVAYEDSIKLPAQSDPAIISVNGDEPVNAGSELIELHCVMKNLCYKAKLEIYGNIAVEHLTMTHVKENDRFTAVAHAYARFRIPGCNKIYCKEEGKKHTPINSQVYVVTVDPSEGNSPMIPLDRPIVEVNGNQTVEASSELIEIVCVMMNAPYKPKLHVFGDLRTVPYVNETHTEKDGRFNTTAIFYATFSTPGYYLIGCGEEQDSKGLYLGGFKLTVHPRKKESDEKDVTKDSEHGLVMGWIYYVIEEVTYYVIKGVIHYGVDLCYLFAIPVAYKLIKPIYSMYNSCRTSSDPSDTD